MADRRAPSTGTASASEPPGAGRTRVLRERGVEHAVVDCIRLLVLDGPSAGTAVEGGAEPIAIGSEAEGGLKLDDPTVSRFHCEVWLDAGRPSLRDLGSRNGTVLDGVSVVHAHLRAGSILEVGQTHVRVDLDDEGARVPLSDRERFGNMVGRSIPMRALFARLERAARSDATVLLEGETGTGKEAAAEAIHLESPRAGGPFLVVDCGAVPPALLESELFGHEKGAFTGASSSRAGAFETASGGTLFLDEIGELPLDLQPKLLRALDRRQIKRVGAAHYQQFDVRLIAATNRSLRREVNQKRFRSDLYFRLAVVEARLPSLRERAEDLPLLVEHLLETLGAANHERVHELRTPEFQAQLSRHPWPGNVRELRNHVERALAFESGFLSGLQIDVEPESLTGDGRPLKQAREAWVRTFERRYLEATLARHAGNVSAAARAAGVDRIHFYRLLWRHGLR